MTTVTETLDLPGGGSPVNPTVTIQLVGERGTPIREAYSAGTTIIYRVQPAVVAGAWSQTLPANAAITPAGTRYVRTVSIPGGRETRVYIDVPASGTYRVDEILSAPPSSIDNSPVSVALALVQAKLATIETTGADIGDVLAFDGDGWVPDPITIEFADATGASPATGDYVLGTDTSNAAANAKFLLSEILALASGGSYQPLDADLTAIAALSPSNDDIVQRKAGVWTNRTLAQLLTDLGLGSLYQPLDGDLTSIAALTTTAYGRAFLVLANQAALMALLSASSETASGVVELATTAEATTGTDTVRAVTPAGVKAVADAILDGVTFTGDVVVPDEAYDATAWNGSLEVPTKNAVRDKIEALGGGGSSELLASLSHAPSGPYTSTTTAAKDVDATNLTVTFTVPASGAVLARLTTPYLQAPTTNQAVVFMLRDTGGTLVTGSDSDVLYQSSALGVPVSYAVRITGLTPSASLTWRWGWSQSGTNTATLGNGSTTRLTMEIWSA